MGRRKREKEETLFDTFFFLPPKVAGGMAKEEIPRR